MLLLQAVIIGVMLGAFYGLVAIGMALVFGVMKYMNMAHGSLMILGGYISYWLFKLYGIDPFLSIPIVVLIMAGVGLVLYRVLLRSLDNFTEDQKMNSSMLLTFGLVLVMDNTMLLLWSSDVKAIATPYAGSALQVASLRIPITGLGMFGVTLVVIFALHQFLRRTFVGKAIRATAERFEATSLLGVNVSKTYLISCAIGVGLAGVAGSGIATMYSISPSNGLSWLLTAMVVLVMAGMGNIRDVFLSGIILGLLEQVGTYFFGGQYRVVFSLVLFVLIMSFRPRGLFAR
jgi:branched-chain amino acid transport system permease protein